MIDVTNSSDDTTQIQDAQSSLSMADFAKRQMSQIERQMLSATDLADLINLALTGVR